MIILGCFGGTTIWGNIHIYPSIITTHRSLGGKLISLKPQRGPELSNRRSSGGWNNRRVPPPKDGAILPQEIQGLTVGWKVQKSHSQPPFGCKEWKKTVFLVGWTLPTSVNWWSLDFWTINSIMGLWRPLVVFLIITLSDAGFMYFLPWGWQP